MSEAQIACPTCGAEVAANDRYCEQCGTRVAPASDHVEPGCAACGAPAEAIDADRYCSRCGTRQRSPDDRQEVDLTVAGGVCDRGRVRRHNEDALHLHAAAGSGVAAVVCDGISSALSAGLAARRAAEAAGATLGEALQDGEPLTGAMIDAAGAAQRAVSEVPWTTRSDLDVPSCTLVAAVCRNGHLVVGWIGDSRAYWIAGEGSRQLTVDDSWAQEQVDAGTMSAQEAGEDERAHTITRWLGVDAPSEIPQVVELALEERGRLVLCSDGLWNYTPQAAEIAALLDALPPETAPIAAARSLADAALAAGGHDNITVAVLDVEPSAREEP